MIAPNSASCSKTALLVPLLQNVLGVKTRRAAFRNRTRDLAQLITRPIAHVLSMKLEVVNLAQQIQAAGGAAKPTMLVGAKTVPP